MKEKFLIFGQKLTSEELGTVEHNLDEIREESLKPIEGELEKTKEELKFIKTADSYLKEEFEEMGIEKKPVILPGSVHLLPHDTFNKICPSKESSGIISFPENAIYIDKSAPRNRLELFKIIFHESVHLLAFQKVHVAAEEESNTARQYRRGYYVKNPKEGHHEHFRGLGEAIVDKTVMEIFRKKAKELIKEFNISKEEEESSPVAYQKDYIEILDIIIKGIAAKNNEDERLVWQDFKKGQFTGEMMHLKKVEDAFGKGSLRILASLGSATKSLSRAEVCEKILRYFETKDEKEKDRLASEVLIEREQLRYKNLREKG